MLGTCWRLAVLLFLVFDLVVGGGSPTPLPAQTAFARVSDPSLPVRAGPPTQIVLVSGSPQSTPVNTAFPAALVAQVLDSNMQPVSGQDVLFLAPSNGASGTF